MPRPTIPPPKGNVKYVPQDAVEQFRASAELIRMIIFMICLVNVVCIDIALLVIPIVGFSSLSIGGLILFLALFILCLTMTFFMWRGTAKERCKYLEAKRKAKETYNLTEHESRDFWRKHGDYVLAVVFAVLIPVAMILTIRYKFESILGWSINLACISMFILSLIMFYYHYRPVRPTKVIKTIVIFMVVAFFFIGATPNSWLESQPDPNIKRISACQDNLRTIDSGIMMYAAEHGEGVYPTSLDEPVPYIRHIPEEPSGGIYYLDTTTTPPHSVCSEGHTY